MSQSAIPRELRDAIKIRDRGRCRYCRLSQFGQAATFHVNHVIPKSEGGKTSIENLVTQCPYCSLHKSNKLGGHDPQTNVIERLFHPLNDSWEDHFVIAQDGTCGGKTAVGRVTAAELRMNDFLPRNARVIQILLGLIE